MKKVGLILSGCGVKDGSEIHEAVMALYFLDKNGADIKFFAPDKKQRDVIDHYRMSPAEENRNCLVEAARIARGDIKPLSEIDMEELDAVILPGGFGAAKNLCDFADRGAQCDIDKVVEKILKDAHEKKKVIGCICIAPAVVARAFSGTGLNVKLTVGTDKDTMNALRSMGADPVEKEYSEICVDEDNRIVSTPAYMLGKSIAEIAEGIGKLVQKVLEMA